MSAHTFENLLSEIERKLHFYSHGIRKRGNDLEKAITVSQEELWKDFKDLISAFNDENPEKEIPWKIILLYRDLLGGGIWILRSYLRLLKAFIKNTEKHQIILEDNHEEILDLIINDVPLDEHSYGPKEIFKTIFHDLCQDFDDPVYSTQLKMPKVNYSVCLVSGALNELFPDAPFERGVKHLSEVYGFEYVIPNVHGRKDVKHNAKIIEKELKKYCEINPNKRIWILAFSKGGIDTLHFLKNNTKFANQHILGMSAVAVPIQGTLAASTGITKIAKEIHKFDNTWLYKKLDRDSNLFLKNFPKFLSEEYQKGWLKWNKHRFPQNIFYTSLAFESSWYDAHIGMMATKLLFKNDTANDGIVDIKRAHFPKYFHATNLGHLTGHHLISARSSTFNQEALVQALIITLNYLKLLP